MTYIRLIRFVLTITLLGVVWVNVHWSVALCLTLLAAVQRAEELERERRREYLRRLGFREVTQVPDENGHCEIYRREKP